MSQPSESASPDDGDDGDDEVCAYCGGEPDYGNEYSQTRLPGSWLAQAGPYFPKSFCTKESARDLHRLQIAMRQGFSTWEEYCRLGRETESFTLTFWDVRRRND